MTQKGIISTAEQYSFNSVVVFFQNCVDIPLGQSKVLNFDVPEAILLPKVDYDNV